MSDNATQDAEAIGRTYELRRQTRRAAPPRGPRRGRRIALLVVLVLVAAAAGVVGTSLHRARSTVRAASAVVQADLVAVVAEVDGRLTEILVSEGQKVEAGSVVATLEVSGTGADLAEAQAQRRTPGAESGPADSALPDPDPRAGAATPAVASASRGEATPLRAASGRYRLTSPVAGTVVQVAGGVGDPCGRGEGVVVVRNDARGYWVDAWVPEVQAPLVRPGQPARVEVILGSGEWVDAEVESVSAATARALGVEAVPAGGGPTYSGPELVGVRLRFAEQRGHFLAGSSARVAIRVR
jgi:multidrug resistance efflux pump